jgi:MFS family permease
MQSWGWRVPLLIGCVVLPVMFWLRASLAETAVFAKKKKTPTFAEIGSSLIGNWRLILLCMSTVAFATVTSQTIQTYAPTYIASLNLGAFAGFITLFFVGLTTLISLPLCALVADRVNRRSMLIVVTTVAALSAYPLLSWLAAAPSVTRFVVFELWFSFMYGAYSSVQVATMVELVPASARTAGYAFSQAVAAAIFGGFTPVICTWLNHTFNNNAMVGVWLAVNAVLGLGAALSLKHQKTWEAQHAEFH